MLDDIIPVGTIVKKNGSFVLTNDNLSSNLIVGIVIRSYQDEDGYKYSEVHLGGGVVQVILKNNWDGNWSPITVSEEGIKPASSSDKYHGYLIPSLPTIQKYPGDLVNIYWRGIT